MFSKCLPTITIWSLSPFFLLAQNPCDTIQVVAQATATKMTCADPFATLTGAQHPSALSYAWSGPGGFTSSQRVAMTFVKGTYTLTVTGPMGCTKQASVSVVDLCTSYELQPPECTAPYEQVIPADNCLDIPSTAYSQAPFYKWVQRNRR